MEIAGASALVTGGGSGIGAAVAARLAAGGARVVLLDRDGAAAEAVAARLGGAAVAGDVAEPEAVERALEAASALGPLRTAVSCAGVAPAARILGREGPHDLGLFARVVSVNLVGTFNVLRLAAARMAALPPLEDGERGVIVNLASIAAYEGQVGQAAYAASKAGVAGLTLPAARDLARHGVRVVAVAPGLVGTPMLDALPEAAREALAALPVFPRRLGRPEEVAEMVAAVLANRLLNGEVIRLDAALRMPP